MTAFPRFSVLLSAFLVIPFLFTACQKTPSDMVLVPSGPFLMGTNEVDKEEYALSVGFPHPWYEDEQPLRKVHLPAFTIDLYEVSNGDYGKFVKASNRTPPRDWTNGDHPEGRGRFPVIYVNWYEADAYCRWLGKRLPTEAEWEKAARGTEGQLYPWGNEFDPKLANIARAAVMMASNVAVGQYEKGRSPYGVYDMIGNVWEWTDSLYEPYPGSTAMNENFGRGLYITRGLSFMSVGHFDLKQHGEVSAIVARTSFRSYDQPTSRLADVGFRCVQSVQ